MAESDAPLAGAPAEVHDEAAASVLRAVAAGHEADLAPLSLRSLRHILEGLGTSSTSNNRAWLRRRVAKELHGKRGAKATACAVPPPHTWASCALAVVPELAPGAVTAACPNCAALDAAWRA